MNRFRTKKKAKDGVDGASRPSTESDAPTIQPLKSAKSWGRKKNQEPEPKVELDLSTALPSSDNFRTSLLMNGLSARFSMLREQDDPSSKLGKASDDSVLFPSKRQSRLNGFGYEARGLSDIAEVSSINGSIRPPFAAFARKDSYNTLDGYGTDDDSIHSGSIMSRAKPGEGNNLFGGRQKIYKIPNGASSSSKSLAEGGTKMGGRVLYEDDVSQSAFQKLREREREQERLQKEQEQEQEREESEQDQRTHTSRPSSPPLAGYNRNRETSSTTSSGPNVRISTAATSITSQRTPSLSGSHSTSVPTTPAMGNPALERSTTKARRLYETGLDKDLHEQQFSAMSRIDTLARQRTLGSHTPPPGLMSPTSSTTLDRFERQQIGGKTSTPNLRAGSPTPPSATVGTFDFGPKPIDVAETKTGLVGFADPPLSPPMSEDDHGALPVQPNDRGKATALLSFSKPAQAYDENKYSQRQLQMQQGRQTPPPRKHSPPGAFVPRQQPNAPRNRADSSTTFASGRSRSTSSAQRHFPPPERHMRDGPAPVTEITVPEDHAIAVTGSFLMSPGIPDSPDHAQSQPIAPWGRTESQSPSLPKGYRPDPNQSPILERPPESMHPANRPITLWPEDSNGPPPERSLPTPKSTPNLSRLSTGYIPKPRPKSDNPEDSPTLGPATGLSGMVRQHLRSDSNTSSVFGGGPSSASFTSRFPQDPLESLPPHDYNSTKSNPWDLDDWDRNYGADKLSMESRISGTKAPVPAPLSVRSPNTDNAAQEFQGPNWQQEMISHHARVGSTETQIERKELANDLATRRKQVQEKMKSVFVENDNQLSPLPGMDWAKDGTSKNNPLGLLKQKSSKGSLAVRAQREPQPQLQLQGSSKAMKMFGIGSPTLNSSTSPSKKVFDDSTWKEEEEEMMHGMNPPTLGPQTKAFRQARRDAQRAREQQVMTRHHQERMQAAGVEPEWYGPSPIQTRPQQRQRAPSGEPGSVHTGHPAQRTRTPSRERQNHPPPSNQNARRLNGNNRESQQSSSSGHSGSRPASNLSRDRSSSDASRRSKSHNGRYRDDIAQAMAEGIGSSSKGGYIEPPVAARLMPKSPGHGLAFQPSTSPNILPSPSFQSTPAIQPQPFHSSPAYPSPTTTANGLPKARSNSRNGYFDQGLSPNQTLESVELGAAPRPSPVAPFVVNPTPPVNQPSPINSNATTPTTSGFQSNGRIPTNRKKSINKSDISEPTFLSSTSRITTINLPPGASLTNGAEPSPPIPPVNPRRRQTRVQTMFGALAGRKEDRMPNMYITQAAQSTDAMSTFSADEVDKSSKQRQKLRKSSSEGGNMNARARQHAMAMPSPALPSGPKIEGGMF